MPIDTFNMKTRGIVMLWLCLFMTVSTHAKDHDVALDRVFNYKKSIQSDVNGVTMNVYLRYHFRTDKKNKLLLTVPSMYVLARKNNNEFVGESYSKVTFSEIQKYESTLQVAVGTVPRYKNVMPTMIPLMTPKLYDVTIVGDHLLSPFHPQNEPIYRYGITSLTDNRVEIVFRPKKYNTQLVSGRAVADATTGRIMHVEFTGEYDMIRFHANVDMGEEGVLSLLPKSSNMEGTFKYLGNKIRGSYLIEYNQDPCLPDSIVNSHDRALMDSLRPLPLPSYLAALYHHSDSIDSLRNLRPKKVRKKNVAKTILWDAVGDNLVNRIKGHFGSNDQGYFRISPILNPLYMGYSERKGVNYKMKLNLNYDFSPTQTLRTTARLGYFFKLHQFYFNIPIRYTYNTEKNGYVEIQVGNGNRITSSSIRQQLMEEFPDMMDWDENNERTDYFKDMYMKVRSNHDITKHWGVALGVTFHRRSAVDKEFFRSINMPDSYHSFAPMFQTKWWPWGDLGPIFTLSYEQGINGIGKANMEYGRAELDASWLRKFYRMRSLSMRFGSGYYLLRGHDAYFLDFENFREDNMPGGWNDDWTGEFQLLHRDMYNTSRYYLRANLTYESPLMLMSRLPIVGKVIEMERIYVSGLVADQLHPYTEWGYGFTNRLFSIGVFMATRNFKYDGIGCQIGLELFRDW
jgi:hypothetical protein